MDSSDEGSKVGNEKGGRSENETPGEDSSDKCSNVGSRVEGDQDSEVQEPAEMHPAILSGDFGRVVGLKAQRKVTDSEKFFLLKHHVVPRKGNQFPSRTFSGRQRHFQSSWLDKYSGLVYSESEYGGYCKFCVLFATCEPSVRELGVLVTRPLTNFKKVIDKLNEHFCSQGRKSHQDYFHLNLTIPLLDHLLSELNSRFDAASSQNIMEFMRLSTISNFCCKARSTGL